MCSPMLTRAGTYKLFALCYLLQCPRQAEEILHSPTGEVLLGHRLLLGVPGALLFRGDGRLPAHAVMEGVAALHLVDLFSI